MILDTIELYEERIVLFTDGLCNIAKNHGKTEETL